MPHRHCLASSQERRCEQRPISCVQEMGRCFIARNAMFDTGPLSCLRRFQSGRRTKALDVSPRAGHQMGRGEKRAFLHARTAKDHGKISLKCIPRGGPRRIRESAWRGGQRRMREGAWRGARADREGVPDWRLARREQGRFRLAARQTGTGASPIGEPRYLIGGILRSASALAFLLRSPFRSQLRQALHWARNR